MQTNWIELAMVAAGLALLCLLLLNIKTARAPSKPMSLAPITKEESRAVQEAAEAAARDYVDSGFTTTNPYPTGTRERIIWETTFHSSTLN